MRRPKWTIVFTLGIGLALAQVAWGQTGSFATTGSMTTARVLQRATLLNNGLVLITGGATNNGIWASAELYNASTGTFAATGSMTVARDGHTATLLNNGKVLIAGGTSSSALLSSAELYDPSTGTFTSTGNLNTARAVHTATLLNNGEVLITGGQDSANNAISTAELYNPVTGTFSYTGSLETARVNHTATLLNNGQVLIAAGSGPTSSTYLSSAELYDPASGVFSYTGSLHAGRYLHTATLFGNGEVLIVGGICGIVTGPRGWSTTICAQAEVYNPAVGSFTAVPGPAVFDHTATLLNDGTVLVAGGINSSTSTGSNTTNAAEVYSPFSGTFSATGSMLDTRQGHTATALLSGGLLVAGGEGLSGRGRGFYSEAELYTPGAVTGYVNPKFVVVGVTYAPPGPSTNTWVNYKNSTTIGTTNSLTQSVKNGVSYSVSLSLGFSIPMVASGKVTTMKSSSSSQESTNASTVTMSFQTTNGEQTGGTGSYWAPVDNDYDIIWVWLNPAIIMTVSNNAVVWNGYGADATDQNGMDVVGVQLGYLNGDFGSMPPQFQTSFNRAWAANQMWPAGEGPALSTSDYAQIAAFDPFSKSTYGTNYVGYAPPSPETSDSRFTMTTCTSVASFDYLQAAPSQTPAIYTCTLTYTNNSIQAKSITAITTQTYSVDQSFSGSVFFQTFGKDVSSSSTLTTTTTEQSSISNTTSSTASLSVQGPPCNNQVPELGPCIPVYDSSGNQPIQFDVYQDNLFGTFMFAPVHYY